MDNLALVKKLRLETGAGIDLCRSAATESNGDYEKALEFLKAKGLEKAAKKINNITENGSIIVRQNDKKAILLNFRAETDFAINGEGFCEFISKEAQMFLESEYNDIKDLKFDNLDFQNRLSVYASVLGENVTLNACEVFYNTNEVSNIIYFHKKIRKGYEDIAALVVVLTVTADSSKEEAMNIAAHIAAADSLVLSKEDITDELRQDHENIDDLVLFDQSYFYDNNYTVKEFADKNNIRILNFRTFIA